MVAKKYEVGTKVRLTAKGLRLAKESDWYDVNLVNESSVGEVIANDVDWGMYRPYRVRFNDSPTWYLNHEHIEPALRFAVGDKVLVTCDMGCCKRLPATITRVNADREFVYDIRYDDGSASDAKESYLEPAPVVVEYGVGDRVKVRRTYVLTSFAVTGAKQIDTGVVFRGDYGTLCVRYDSNGGHDAIGRGCEFLAVIEKAKPIAPPAPAKPALKVGDKVRVVKSHVYTDCYAKGAEGVVVADDNGEYFLELTLGGVKAGSPRETYAGQRPHDGYYADELELVVEKPVVTIAVSNLRFTRKGERVIVEANGKRVASVSVEELRKMVDVIEGEAK